MSKWDGLFCFSAATAKVVAWVTVMQGKKKIEGQKAYRNLYIIIIIIKYILNMCCSIFHLSL